MHASGRLSRLLIMLALTAGAARAADHEPALVIYGMESKPICFTENGKPAGFAVELAQQVTYRLNRHDDIKVVPWARASAMALAAPNVMALTMVRTPERELTMRFVGPIFNSYIAIFASKSQAPQLRAQGRGAWLALRGAARRGSAFIGIAQRHGYRITDETNGSESAARMLVQGRFDLWFEGEEIAMEAARAAGLRDGEVELLQRLETQEVNFAFSRATPVATVQAWEAALRDMKRDGTFQKLHRKWLPGYPLPGEAKAGVPAKAGH